MNKMDVNLRKYLQQNYDQLTWKERIQIAANISSALIDIHKENLIHKDLHSGNRLYSKLDQNWYICDLGFCGPVDKLLNGVYGKLSYIA
ncbi:hypothetical protein RclHR1_06680004 [Rhizophagus clarus]|nr:hypothetical protein RclHR1_06680004 [Rhizophagus clarus]